MGHTIIFIQKATQGLFITKLGILILFFSICDDSIFCFSLFTIQSNKWKKYVLYPRNWKSEIRFVFWSKSLITCYLHHVFFVSIVVDNRKSIKGFNWIRTKTSTPNWTILSPYGKWKMEWCQTKQKFASIIRLSYCIMCDSMVKFLAHIKLVI